MQNKRFLNKFKNNHPLRRGKSFQYAFEGIFHALFNEPNFRIQVVITAITIVLGIYYKISSFEWALLAVSMGFLLSAEMVNTVIEEISDHFVKEENPTVKIVKDLGSGFVLVAAISTLIVLYLTFGWRIIQSLALQSLI